LSKTLFRAKATRNLRGNLQKYFDKHQFAE
jgi:hypothetical protein